MPPRTKKSKKDEKPKGQPEKVYDLLSLDEMNVREQKYTNRLRDLRVCLNFIDDALIQTEQLKGIELIADKWQDFISCNPLPKPYIPPEVRLFFTKLKHFEDKNVAANIDWPLAVDERSILAQNIYRQDLTRTCLKDKLKPEFGCEYNRNVNDSLNVLARIEYFLDNDVEVAKCPYAVLADIKEQRLAIQEEISKFLDRYTYRILCSEDAYMKSVDAIATEYSYSADNFQMHIWSLKNVPICFSHLDEPRLVADFHEVKIRLHIPSTMLRQNLTIRAIRLNFDHISEKAKSFSQLITVPVDNLNAGIQDLHECLINEWLMQLNMQKRLREDMIQKRLDYEDKLRQFEEEEARKGKTKKASQERSLVKAGKTAKKSKIVKPSKEPPLIGENVFPDVYTDFLEEEQKQYDNFINYIYNPDSLGLDSDEINLKRFFILGGVYQLHYVEKPTHFEFDFDRFNMTWHRNDSKLMVFKDMFIAPTPGNLSLRTTRMSLRRESRFDKDFEPPNDSTDPECPWFVLTVTLPEYLCSWGEPTACHYETTTKIVNEKEVEEHQPASEARKKSKGARRFASNISLPTSQTSAGLEKEQRSFAGLEYRSYLTPYEAEGSSSMLKLRRLSATQRLSQGNFFRSSLSLRISHADFTRPARSSDGTLNIEDFPLSVVLNKSQIRHLQRHCLPRIISSFKFPKEIREEELEALSNRPKGKGGIIVRKQANILDDVYEKSVNRVFAFNDMQNNPERIFAIYPTEELIRVIRSIEDEDTTDQDHLEPVTFLELLKLLSLIKTKYKLLIRRTLDLRGFKSKVKLENKRWKKQLKRYERKPLQTSISVEKNVGQNKGTVTRGLVKRPAMRNKLDDLKTPKTAEEKQDLKRRKGSKISIVEPMQDFSTESQYRDDIKEPQAATYSHWTTRHIISSEYDKEKHTIVIQTDRLGYIGFAFKRYEHFPFKYWSLEPSESEPENEVVFTLETQYVRCVLYCTPNGIRGHVTEPTKKFVRNPKMYLIIDQPMKDYKEFKKIFKDNYLNIFAEHDACYYIENGYFSEKHLATEMHTYCCMAVHSTQMKFNFSQWNRLAKRRDLILKFVQFKDLPENTVEVRITPEEAFFVEITELCSDDLDVIKLNYALTWRNIGSYTDLHHLINSMYPAATDCRCKNPKLISCIRDLLNEIRPLSFS